jgi:hypothetical protein
VTFWRGAVIGIAVLIVGGIAVLRLGAFTFAFWYAFKYMQHPLWLKVLLAMALILAVGYLFVGVVPRHPPQERSTLTHSWPLRR